MRVVLPIAAIVLAAHWFGSGEIGTFLKIDQPAAVKVLGLYICTEFLEALVIGLSIGLKRPQLAGLVVVIEPIAKVIGGMALVLLGLGITGAMAGFPIGNLAGFGLGIVVLWPVIRRRAQADGEERKLPQPLDRYALVALLVNVGLMLVISVDQVVVKHFFAADVAGNYAVAWVLGRVIAITTISFGWVVFASSASLSSDDPRRAWVLARGLLAIGGISALVTAVFFAFPGQLVRLMTGSSYSAAYHYLGLIGIEMTLFSLVYVQAYYHLSVRKLRIAWVLGAAGAVEVGLLATYHNSIEQVLLVLILVMAGLLVAVSALSVSMFRRATDRGIERAPQLTSPTTSELT